MTRTRTLRSRTFELLELEESRRGFARPLNVALAVLIVLNVAAVALETVASLAGRYAAAFAGFERFSLAVFSLEYLLRLWSCVEDPRYARPVAGRLRYMVTPMALVDLLAIAPGLVPNERFDLRFVRSLRLLRLLSAFKMARYTASLQTLGRVLRARRSELAITALAGGLILVCAASGIYFAEHDAQPETFSSIPAAMWWGIVTLTTVGYGDAYPVTVAGKLLASVIAVLGIGLFALPAGIIANGFAEEMRRGRDAAHAKRCPHCGKALDERPASH